ncbi:MAG: hypothetical protein GY710_01530 [Desulfobacteraceae bacterium]|nr:hypothetical protein [Desulfobacteraceae bacterium]
MKQEQKTKAVCLVNPLSPMVTFGLVIFLMFLALGCGKKSPTTPVDDKNPNFSKARFLTANGVGNTQIDARRQALAELSSVFESKVQSQTTSLAKSSLGSDNKELFEKTIESRIQIISSVRLKGAEIGKEWQDKATGVFHALAVLDKVDAGKNWTNDLEIIDNQLRAKALALEKITGRLSRMAALNKIISLSLQRHVIKSRLMVIGYPDLSEFELDMARMTSQLAVIQSELRFYIDIKGKYGAIAKNLLAQTLTRNGILITRNMDRADALIQGKIVITPLTLKNPNVTFVRGTGDIKVIEPASHALFAQISENIRKGHVDKNEAVHKAALAISQLISQKLLSALGLNENHPKESVQ